MRLIIICVITSISIVVLGQNVNTNSKLYIKPIDSPIKIDGFLSKSEWGRQQTAKTFISNFPNNSEPVLANTEVKMCYDDKFIYVAAQMKLPDNFKGYNIQSLRRDFNLLKNEAFLIALDTYSDFTNGYYFEITPFGNQGELLASNSGRFGGVNSSWDNTWQSAVQKTDYEWTAEIAIPFRILRFEPSQKSWRVNFIRIDNTNNQYSSWIEVPRNFDVWDLNFSGEIHWESSLPNTKTQPTVIPSITSIYEDGQTTNDDVSMKPSLDVKLNIGASLNLDLTVNPDFSQTEVDQQQLNIGRFELFFPEKRQFFLENEDLFSSYGFLPIRPFFSRRIGLTFDPNTGTNKSTPILGGLRLSGKLNERLRIGVMTMQTDKQKDFFVNNENDQTEDLPSINYTVASIQQQVFKKSNLKLLFVNKQLSNSSTEIASYNRVIASQFNFINKKGNYYGWFFGSKSFSPNINNDDFSFGSSMVYNTRKWRVLWSGRQVMENYNAETGFVPRKDVVELFANPAYRIYPGGFIAENRIGISSTFFQNGNFENIEKRIGLYSQTFFKSAHSLRIQYNNDFILLRSDFDPSGKNDLPLLNGTDYKYQYATLEFESNQRDSFWYEFSGSAGEYFNGSRYEFGATLNYRIQPYINFSILYNRVKVNLPTPYSSSTFNIVTPKIDASISKSMFLTLVAQYNEQFNNLNTNFRLQWRFRPVSDLYFIYLNNRDTNNWNIKGQSFTLKLIYWI